MERLKEPSLGEYAAVLKRRLWIVLLAAVVVPAAAVYFSSAQSKLYAASTDVLLTSAATGVQSPLTSDGTSLIATQQEIAASPLIAQRVVRAAHITTRTAAEIHSELSLSAVGNADVLRITIKDRSPVAAVQLANLYARQYTEYRRSLDTSFIDSTRKEIQARMTALRDAGQQRSPLYTALAQKEQDLVQVAALQTVSAVVLRPSAAATRIRPSPKRDGALGLIVGLMLGLGLALVAEAIDPRVRTTNNISELVGLPVLGRLSTPRWRLRRKKRLVMLEDTTGEQANALRILSTNLDFANASRGAKLVMITSPTEGEGKSTTAANLAVAFARNGRRVLLADLDLHRPVIAKFFDVADGPGLTGAALGRFTLDDAIERVPIAVSEAELRLHNGGSPGDDDDDGPFGGVAVLQVLPTGPIPTNPSEFVASPAVRSVLDELRERAEIVIIDAPPLLAVSDTLALSGIVDAVVLVTRVKGARRAILHQARHVLDSAPAAKLGIVVTGIEHEEGDWYDRYGTYYYSPSGTSASKFFDASAR
jgi:polysaccharide biosynthesis transport protein